MSHFILLLIIAIVNTQVVDYTKTNEIDRLQGTSSRTLNILQNNGGDLLNADFKSCCGNLISSICYSPFPISEPKEISHLSLLPVQGLSPCMSGKSPRFVRICDPRNAQNRIVQWFPVRCNTEKDIAFSLSFLRNECENFLLFSSVEDLKIIFMDYCYLCDQIDAIVFCPAVSTFRSEGFILRIWSALHVIRSSFCVQINQCSNKIDRKFSMMLSRVDPMIVKRAFDTNTPTAERKQAISS